MINKINIRYTRTLLLILFGCCLNAQSLEELNQLKKAYEDQERALKSSEIIKQGVEDSKGEDSRPVQLLVEPSDIFKYYEEKMKVIQKELNHLGRIAFRTDSLYPLEYFGYNYFSLRDSIQFIDNANVSSNYVLGYGDEIIISVWGQAEQHEQAFLDRDGTVFVKNVGLLYLGGKSLSQAKSYINDRFGKIYSTIKTNPPLTFLEFSIGRVKNINITVAGNVQYPGNYVVNPSMSLFNILVLAGGIIESGSLRNIKVQRQGSIVDSLDLYPLITGLGIVKSIPLRDNDIIIVPPRGKTIALTGAILKPAFYEIKINDNVNSALKFSGGINQNGNQQVLIFRNEGLNIHVPENKFQDTGLLNGDSLTVLSKLTKFRSITVSVDNNPVFKIPWIKDLPFNTILNIISVEEKNIKNIELVRLNQNNNVQKLLKFDLQKENFDFLPFDHLSIQTSDRVSETRFVVVKGRVNSPGIYPLINEKESLNSILLRSGGLQPSSDVRSVIVKRDSISFGSRTGELVLFPGDTIIAEPFIAAVLVKGEVHNPGNIEWSSDNLAQDYINFSGGLSANADKKHIVLITPYGEASRISKNSKSTVLPGSVILVKEKPLADQKVKPDRFQQFSSLITSMVTIAILASTTTSN